jgi:hypothetical protein
MEKDDLDAGRVMELEVRVFLHHGKKCMYGAPENVVYRMGFGNRT